METDTQVLKSIIEEYYGRSNDSAENGEENSPMIIKILNPNWVYTDSRHYHFVLLIISI